MSSTMDLSVVTIAPTTAHTHTVIFLHGRGDEPKNFSQILSFTTDTNDKSLMQSFPSFKWVFPAAPVTPCARTPKRRPMPQWFDVWGYDKYDERNDLKIAGLRECVPALRNLVIEEARKLEWQWEKIILAGISQGGATVLHTLFNFTTTIRDNQSTSIPAASRFGAVMVFSCRLPLLGLPLQEMRGKLGLLGAPNDDAIVRNTPLLLEHNEGDDLIKIEDGRRLRDQLESWGSKVTWKEYPDGAHWFNAPKGVDDTRDFLHWALGLEVSV